MLDQIKSYVNTILPMPDAEWIALQSILEIKRYSKKTLLWKTGDICRDIAFINKGMMRISFTLDRIEKTHEFFTENSFITEYYSFISQQPINFNFEFLEDSELLLLPRKKVYECYDMFPFWERFGRMMAEQNFIELHNEHVARHSFSPEELYLKMLTERPRIIETVPQHMIASYLNITPEHLSRVRKKISVIG
jgi:CRP-like cAMP-binding protein